VLGRSGLRLAALALGVCFAAAVLVEGWLLLHLRQESRALAGVERTAAATAATQLVLAHQSLHAALLEHRLGGPELAPRQAYEGFAARLEQMRATALAADLTRLPGLRATLQQAGQLTARVDAALQAAAPDQLPSGTAEMLARGLPSLREPLTQLLAAVTAAQALAQADLMLRLERLQRLAAGGFMLLLVAVAAAGAIALIGVREIRRAGLQQARLTLRAQELRSEAEEAMRGRLDALAFVAAETNARINGVSGSIARAADLSDRDPRLREALAALRVQTDDLLVLATDLSDLARLEAGQLRLRPAPFRLADAMEQAADLLRHRFRGEAVTIEVAAPEGLPAWWIGDAARVRQLLHHLGSAAAELSEHGRLILSAQRLAAGDGDSAELPERLALHAVIEVGPEVLPRDPAGEVLRHSLSLTLVRTLASAMGGRFARRDSSQGRISLSVTLPLSTGRPPAAATQDATAEHGPLDVLVVDDVVLNRRLLAAVLERFGHRCEMASDGLEALRAVQQHRFDVVLMDIQMPNLDGMAATRMLRALPPPAGLVPVIAVTAAGEPEDRAAYAAAGMDGFVQKPVATSDLLAAIASAVGPRAREAPGDGEGSAELAVGPLMDTQTVAILRSTLAPDELARLVAATEAEATAALRLAEAAAARGDAPAMAQAVAALIQACEGIGASRVIAIARAVLNSASDGAVARAGAHLPSLRRALGETLAAISRSTLIPRLVAPALAADQKRA
jgi:hypothetical protein